MKKRTEVKKKKPAIDITVTMFNKLLGYFFCDTRTRAFAKKLDIFFNSVDLNHYREDVDLNPRFSLLYEINKAYLHNHVDDMELMLESISGNPDYADDFEEIMSEVLDQDITSGDCIAIENMIIDRLNFAATLPTIERLEASISRLRNGEFSNYGNAIEDIHKLSVEFSRQITAKHTHAFSLPELSFANPKFKEQFKDVHKRVTDEKRMIVTGLKRFNRMLGGGFQPGRVYIFLGVTGGWKSALLLNILFWAAKFNGNMKCNDQSKKPLFLYISQENDLEETLERTMSYTGATDSEMNAIKDFEKVFKLYLEAFDMSNCDIRMLYRPKGSIDTSDLDTIINDIEAEGEYEVKLLIHDYLKRIRPAVMFNDIRLDLGEAVNDMSILAKSRKIPVISANQMNREAYKLLEQEISDPNVKNAEKKMERKDLGRGINLSMQSESSQISENADGIYAINREFVKTTNEWFLSIKDLKNRGSKKNRDSKNVYFAHPFEEGNSMRLLEDYTLDSCKSIDNIADSLEGYEPNEEVIEEDVNAKKPTLESAFEDD